MDKHGIGKYVREKGNLVLFIGNGIRRLPTILITPENETQAIDPSQGNPGPSWQRYMEDLWDIVPDGKKSDDEKSKDGKKLPFPSFSRLSPPRQAEWFDRSMKGNPDLKIDDAIAPVIRMHMLGRDLHPNQGVPSNHVLDALSRIELEIARHAGGNKTVYMVTTNVDCALEQNLAWADDPDEPLLSSIEVWIPQGKTAVWQREGGERGKVTVRILKIHGCLGALKKAFSESWTGYAIQLAELCKDDKWKGRFQGPLAGDVPTDVLWNESLKGKKPWKNTWKAPTENKTLAELSESVFSYSEYINLLQDLLDCARRDQKHQAQSDAPQEGEHPEDFLSVGEDRLSFLKQLLEIYKNSPMLFVGYQLHEEDVDVVAALHKTQGGRDFHHRYCLRFRKTVDEEKDVDERLKQMGIAWWHFPLEQIAFASLPGELRLAKRHEWRYGTKGTPQKGQDLDNPWRRSLQFHSSREWERSQQEHLQSLLEESGATADGKASPRLVFAGLASMWHAFAIRQRDDFPSRRRVSAGMTAVDSQVPGGSGLVPAMVAAATAGPNAVGNFAFLTNAAQSWNQWSEIEEFCLGAGIDVQPHMVESGEKVSARTSHVLLYDPHKRESDTLHPRQRMIMDVDEAIEGTGEETGRAAEILRVRQAKGMGAHQDEMLFADKLADGALLEAWNGPIVFETGTTGLELLDLLRLEAPPTVWTAGFGSFVRTLMHRQFGHRDETAGAWTLPLGQTSFVKTWRQLHQKAGRLKEFLELDDPQAPGARKQSYVVKLNSFGRRLGKGGVDHVHEMTFGRSVQAKWHGLAADLWQLVRPCLKNHPKVGHGMLVTLHEAGLMALWQLPGRKAVESIVVAIESSQTGKDAKPTLDFRSSVNGHARKRALPSASIVLPEAASTTATLKVGKYAVNFRTAAGARRHTLGAGDTVRGCFAYGLWSCFLKEDSQGVKRPSALGNVLLASCVLASIKCYAGSFIEFLRVIEDLRDTPAWNALWGFEAASPQPATDRS